MTIPRKIAFACYLLIALASAVFGFRYYFGTELMPYHQVAIGVPWDQIPQNYSFLFTRMMHGAGIGMLTLSAAIFTLLAVPFRRNEAWADLGLLFVSLVSLVPMFLLVLDVQMNTEASPPLCVNALLIVAAIVGFIMSRTGKGRATK